VRRRWIRWWRCGASEALGVNLSNAGRILRHFDFPFVIFRLSLSEPLLPTMTNDKRKMTNGKSMAIPSQTFSFDASLRFFFKDFALS
jgi:hypothetical protein